jgi:hypothetical protein
VAASDGVGEHLAPQLGVLAVAQLLGGVFGEGDVEHVQVAATAAQRDHLAV